MKLSIKNIICNVKIVNNITYISDADCNRVLYPVTRSISRGKRASKEKLVDITNSLKINGILFYKLNNQYIDNCYHNNAILSSTEVAD
jgi:hypothetical protein